MQTVIQVTLSGHSKTFLLEHDAYDALQAYLDRARSRLKRDPDYEEVLRDLELSIGEKLAQSLRGDTRVISRREVEVVLEEVGAVNTGNGDSADTATPPPPARPRRLCRIDEGKWIFGVCQGLAVYSGIAVEWVRAIFVIVTLFTGGIPIIIYIVLMFVLPAVRTRDECNAELRAHSSAV